MPNKVWKEEERRIGKDLGVSRNWKGTSGDIPDVEDGYLSIEVKNQRSIPKSIYDYLKQAKEREAKARGEDGLSHKIPMSVVRRRGKHTQVAIIDWDYFLEIYNGFKRDNKRSGKEN